MYVFMPQFSIVGLQLIRKLTDRTLNDKSVLASVHRHLQLLVKNDVRQVHAFLAVDLLRRGEVQSRLVSQDHVAATRLCKCFLALRILHDDAFVDSLDFTEEA